MKTINVLPILIVFLLLGSSCKTDDNTTNTEPDMEEQTIAGDYSGRWSSITPLNTYDQIPASIRIQATADPNRFIGQFYFTSSFVSCCNSGDSDGSITIDIEGSTITSFTYTDIIPNCNGSFSGTGTISDSGTITINFTGSDCEGEHTGGVLRF